MGSDELDDDSARRQRLQQRKQLQLNQQIIMSIVGIVTSGVLECH